MELLFVEMEGFTEAFQDYFSRDHCYQELQVFLLQNPQAGDVMQGCGGVRKLRWPDPRRGKGKRGGLRICYLHIPEVEKIYMLDVYDKDEAEDLSPAQRKLLAQVSQMIREEELKQKGSQP